jgi:hypothetical protein
MSGYKDPVAWSPGLPWSPPDANTGLAEMIGANLLGAA